MLSGKQCGLIYIVLLKTNKHSDKPGIIRESICHFLLLVSLSWWQLGIISVDQKLGFKNWGTQIKNLGRISLKQDITYSSIRREPDYY